MVIICLKKFSLSALITAYWLTLKLLNHIAYLLLDYQTDIWEWEWHQKWNQVIFEQSQRHDKVHKMVFNQYHKMKKITKTLKKRIPDKNNNYNERMETMILYKPVHKRAQVQVFGVVNRWCPLFYSRICDICLHPTSSTIQIDLTGTYTTTNPAYMWGIMNTYTDMILGNSILEPGRHKTTTLQFTIRNMRVNKRYSLRFMQFKKHSRLAYVHVDNSISVIVRSIIL